MSSLTCLSVAGCHTPLSLLERVSYSADELVRHLPLLRSGSGASALALLSTCQRTEVYARWTGEPDPAALLRVLAEDRALPLRLLGSAVTAYRGEEAARHLLRVATGLESFVLGETQIAGQVRAAAAAMRAAGTHDLELDRLMAAATSAARRAHRGSSLARTGRSVAGAAVDAVAGWNGGSLAGQRVLVVGAGSVATAVVARATTLGATVTVSNRTRRNAEHLSRNGVHVTGLGSLPVLLAAADVVVLATAAPHPLLDVQTLAHAHRSPGHPLLLLDLCVPRNVAPAVRHLDGIRLVDLADLRAADAAAAEEFRGDVAGAEQAVEQELTRYLRWSAARSAAPAVRRLRTDAEALVRAELAEVEARLPEDTGLLVQQAVQRLANRLLHGPTRALLEAAERGDSELVSRLEAVFAGTPRAGT